VKEKLMSLKQAVDVKISNLYKGINKFKKIYQLTTNIIKDENGNLLANSHSILNRWKNYFSQLLNVHGINYVKRTDKKNID
jgi:hypothetical protein